MGEKEQRPGKTTGEQRRTKLNKNNKK